jgi:hypothetical protein
VLVEIPYVEQTANASTRSVEAHVITEPARGLPGAPPAGPGVRSTHTVAPA